MRFSPKRHATLLSFAMLVPVAPRTLNAQMVEEGIARDAKLGAPLQCLHEALLDSTGRAIAHTVTDSSGQFLLEATRPGSYRVQFLIYRWEPLVGPLDTLADGVVEQRAYPLTFTNMLVPDSAYERLAGRESREKYKHLVDYMRSTESDSGWRGVRPVVTDLRLRYPDKRRIAGANGSVLARFIVDSTGSARPDSWQTLFASHPDFEQAMKSTMPKARWTPARIAGRPVCQLVMDYARFYLDRDVARIVLETR